MLRVLVVMAVTVAVIVGTVSIMLMKSHAHLLSVETASMSPVLRPGDAVIVWPTNVHHLRPGDIVSYYSTQSDRVIISHRLISIDPHTGWLVTAGDALGTVDPAFPPGRLAGQVTAVVPAFGRLLDPLRHPLGLVLTIWLPAALVAAVELKRLADSYARPLYSVRL